MIDARRRRRVWRSIQFRVVATATAVVVVLLAGASIALLGVHERDLVRQVDDSLEADAVVVRSTIRGQTAPPDAVPTDLYVQVIDDAGEVTGGSPGEVAPLVDAAELPDEPGVSLTTVRVDGIGPVRVLTERLGAAEATMVVGRPLEPVDDAVAALQRALLVGLPVLAAVLAALMWIVVGRALRPVEAVRLTVSEISEHDLSRRVPEVTTGDELERLVDTMNDLLARLEVAVARERSFVADASHELRSPIAAARAVLETEPGDLRSVASTRTDALAELDRLATLAEELLVLARAEDPAGRGAPRPVDLDELVLHQADRVRRQTDLVVDTAAVSGGQVVGFDTDLARLVENLTSNAVRHTRSSVAFRVEEVDGWVELEVDDDGRGIPAAEQERIFDRFTRVDADRGRRGGGAGLGLAIARAIAAEHGGTIVAATNEANGARLLVQLPAASTRGG